MILVKLQYEGHATQYAIPDVAKWFTAVPRIGDFISFMVEVAPETTVAVSGTVISVIWYEKHARADQSVFEPTVVFK